MSVRLEARNYGEYERAVSAGGAPHYFDWVGVDAGASILNSATTLPWDQAVNHIIAGDRNLQFDSRGGCSLPLDNAWYVTVAPNPSGNVRWTNAIHGPVGNLAIGEGSVHQTGNNRFFQDVLRLMDDSRATGSGAAHVVEP